MKLVDQNKDGMELTDPNNLELKLVNHKSNTYPFITYV